MPAPVMDIEETREDDSPRDSLSTSLGLARITSAPDPIRPGIRSEPRPQLYLFSKSSSTLRNPHLSAEATPPGARGPPTPTPLDTLAERPEKRPRLDNQYDTGKTFKRGGSIEKSSSSIARPRASHFHSTVSPRSSDVSEQEQEGGSPCFNCWDTEDSVSRIVRGVQDLQSEISRILPLKVRILPRASEAVPHEVTKQGLRHSLEWTVSELQTTLRALQGVSATTRPGLPSLTDVVPERSIAEMRRASISGQSSTLATSSAEARQSSTWGDPSRSDEQSWKYPEHARDSYSSSQEASLPPILSPDEMKRSHHHDHNPSHSPRGSGGFVPQSPMQGQRHDRTLPSPPGAHYHSAGLSGPSQYSSTTQAAHASHLQDLQHQISTKTLALQTLQREHDQLLAAFSRSQIRCNTLDKKSQVSDHEINTLTEEKIRLQQQVEQLEAQVEELMQSRDEMQKQSSADGAQWRQIMAMSSQLQIKGGEDARKYKAEREAWEADRAALEQRLRDLEAGPTSSTGKKRALDTGEDDAGPYPSIDGMRQEIIRLRQKCAGLERMLQELSGETEEIDNAISAMNSIRQRIASRKKQDDDS